MANRPPPIQLLHAVEIRTRNHDRLTVTGPRHNQSKWSYHSASRQHSVDTRKRFSGKGSAILPHENDVGAVVAEFTLQLGLDIDIQIQHGCRHRRGDDHGKQSRSRPAPPQHCRSQKHAHKHRSMPSPSAAGRQIPRVMRHRRAHSSPRRANTGSMVTARRIAIALPAKVTITAIARITGNKTGEIEICELKIDSPIRCASQEPTPNPITPPSRASSAASAKNTDATANGPAPSAFISPTSALRSKIAVAMA